MYRYYLSYESNKVLLFESQFQFFTEEASLSHYEKGLAKGLFKFDRARINHVWSALGLWGLIGRSCPVELVRVLCAFGCAIECSFESHKVGQLRASYSPVRYYTKISQSEYDIIKPILELSFRNELDEGILPFIMFEDRLLFGSYYTDYESDSDFQFPKYCQLLEKDICLPSGSIQKLMSQLFHMGFKFTSLDSKREVVLAEKDLKENHLRGYSNEATLFYVASQS